MRYEQLVTCCRSLTLPAGIHAASHARTGRQPVAMPNREYPKLSSNIPAIAPFMLSPLATRLSQLNSCAESLG